MKKPMKKGMKIALIVAASLFAVGIALSTVGFVMMEGNFSLLATETYRTVEIEISDEFSSIDILVNTSNVALEPSEDGKTKVCAFISEKNELFAEVTGGTLSVRETREGGFWNFIAVNFETPSIVLYIPEGEYDRLSVESNTGDLDTDDKFSFASLSFESDTGDAKITSPVSYKLEATTDTGNISIFGAAPSSIYVTTDTGEISLKNSYLSEEIKIETDTGDVELSGVRTLSLEIETDTGDVNIYDVIASDETNINTSTGDVTFAAFDSEKISIRSSTGDVSGELLTRKLFTVDTSTGATSIPYSAEDGGTCDVKTSTGSVKLSVAKS